MIYTTNEWVDAQDRLIEETTITSSPSTGDASHIEDHRAIAKILTTIEGQTIELMTKVGENQWIDGEGRDAGDDAAIQEIIDAYGNTSGYSVIVPNGFETSANISIDDQVEIVSIGIVAAHSGLQNMINELAARVAALESKNPE